MSILTLSTDTPPEIKASRGKHGLRATMLSDRELEATNLFGLRNKEFHSGLPGGAKALPVPTSLLVDAQGKVLWIDQSENYQRRSDPDYVLSALREHLGAE